MNRDKPSVESGYADALPSVHLWAGRPTEKDLSPLPSCPAVYLLLDADGAAIQLATTQQFRKLLQSRLLETDQARSARADLAEIARGVCWREVHSTFESRWRYYLLAREMHPRDYRKLLSFGRAWFLNVDWSRTAPQIRVTERIWEIDGRCAGPWPSRAECTRALEGLWDLFELCRYPEEVARAPGGKRCAYADMGRCDAPCDGSAPMSAYVDRTRAAWRFVCGDARDWLEGAAGRMREASARQAYERAAQLAQQMRFAERWLKDWGSCVKTDRDLSYLLVVPVTRRRKWKLFLFRRGDLRDGPLLSDQKLPGESRIWLETMRQAAPTTDRRLLMEQTWLVAHFLHHRDAQKAIIEPLPGDRCPHDLERRLSEAVAARRAQRSKPDRDGPN